MDFGLGIRRAYDNYAAAYMRIYKGETGYTEQQCEACPYDHTCCNMLVYVTPFEVAPILSYINANSWNVKAWKARIKARWRMVRAHMARYRDESEASDAWYQRGIKCLFYDSADHRCMIYPVRPMACRKLYSTDDCERMKWRTALDNEPVLQARIDLMPHRLTTYQDNFLEFSTLLRSMMGDKPTGMSPRLQAMMLQQGEMEDMEYVNPEACNKKVDSTSAP